MTQAFIDHEADDDAGESVRTAHRLGFSAPPDGPADASPSRSTW